MDDDFADAFVHAAYRDVLRREGYDLSANFDPAIVVRHDPHFVADPPPVRIVPIVLGNSFRVGLCRNGEGLVCRNLLAAPVADRSACGSPMPRVA
jgi:hypothetical protein